MADREKDIRLFQRAAAKRLEAARFLLEHGYNLDAVYLGGYAIECALKGQILRCTAKRNHEVMLAQLTEVGAIGHDFEYLKQILKRAKGKPDAKDRDVFGHMTKSIKGVTWWTTSLRYEVSDWPSEKASKFVEAAQTIHDWCLRG